MQTLQKNTFKAYFDLLSPNYLDWDFYSKYLDKRPPFGAIGDIVDCRTYRRFIPEFNRRETAVEAFLRAVEYNIGLVSHLQPHEELVKEAELMFDKLFNLKAIPSNRSRWTGGTESVRKNPASIFNCSYTAINRLEAFGDVFDLLCLGVGVGYRVFYRDINKLPSVVNKSFVIESKEYKSLPKLFREEETSFKWITDTEIKITVGDSRSGWRKAIMLLFEFFTEAKYSNLSKVTYNFDSVRPFGERIKGFGGKASGWEALEGILKEIYRIVSEIEGNTLRSIDCLDICCATARGVIAGSSRRSALICLFEETDDLCRNAKTDWSYLEKVGKTYRTQSNNTCCIGSGYFDDFVKLLETDPSEEEVYSYLESIKPPKEFYKTAFNTMRALGEPAIDHYLKMVYIRYLAAKKYRPNEDWHQYIDVSTNPCHEIIGTIGKDKVSGGFCNLTTADQFKFVKWDETSKSYYYDYAEAEECTRLLTRIGLRQTEVNIPLTGWNETQRSERLLGVDATNGFQDAIGLLGWDYNSEQSSDLRKKLRLWANDEADKYSAHLGIERPLLVTCVKPNGNTSSVLGSSAGVHWSWDKYYLRRVECNAQDALAKTLLDQGFLAYPSNKDNFKLQELVGDSIQNRLDYFTTLDKDTQRIILNKCNSIVFEFPIKTTSKQAANEVSALEQLENQFLFSIEYTDHMPSVTITVKDNEWEEVTDWVYTNWNKGFITASFFSYFGESYPLLAYQSVEEKEYKEYLNKLVATCSGVKFNGDFPTFYLDESLLDYYENENNFKDEKDLDVADCKSGACPLK